MTGHTRTSTDAGPDFCDECSHAADNWVTWPCPAVRRLVLRRGALAALRDGRVTVLTAATSRAAGRPELVLAEVRGHTGRHVVELTRGRWSCSCSLALCAHQVAVRLVCRDVVDLEVVAS